MKEIPNLHSLKKISQHLKVLYVEDDDNVREGIKKFLLKFFTHVDTAIDGKNGLDLYKEHFIRFRDYYDIVISDIQMPHLNGIEMCEAIKEINSIQKVIITSAYNDKNYLLDMLEIGVDGFIKKPFSAHRAIETLYKVCITFHFDDIQYFKALKESSIVMKIDTDGIITYVNEKLCQTTGYKKEELIGRAYSILNAPNEKESLLDLMKKKANSKEVIRKEVESIKKDGSKFTSESIILPLFNQSGTIKEYMIIKNDITKMIELKQKIIEKEQEEITQQKIKQAKESFLLVFTHELKSPLNAIVNFSSYIKKQILSSKKINEEKITSLLDAILNNSSDVLATITQILEISKINSNKLQYSQEPFSANLLTTSLINKYDYFLKNSNIELTLSAEKELFIYSDRYRVEQILSNILSNAIKYGKDKIAISIWDEGNLTQVSIEDNGNGILDKETIFELYNQGDKESLTRQKQGTGIGLYFVKLLCKDLSIKYSVEDSKKFTGAKFIFSFFNKQA